MRGRGLRGVATPRVPVASILPPPSPARMPRRQATSRSAAPGAGGAGFKGYAAGNAALRQRMPLALAEHQLVEVVGAEGGQVAFGGGRAGKSVPGYGWAGTCLHLR